MKNSKKHIVKILVDINDRKNIIKAHDDVIVLLDKHDRKKINKNYHKLRKSFREDVEFKKFANDSLEAIWEKNGVRKRLEEQNA